MTGSELVTDVNVTLTAGTTSTLNVGTLGADFTGAVTGAGYLDIAGHGVASFAHLATTGEVNLEGGTLDVGSSTASVGNLKGSGTIELASGGSLTIGSDNIGTTFSGAVTGANLNNDGLVKVGSGTLTLKNTTVTGASVYVAGGNLDLEGTNAITYLAVGEGTGTCDGKHQQRFADDRQCAIGRRGAAGRRLRRHRHVQPERRHGDG